jgi:hypothetical protein
MNDAARKMPRASSTYSAGSPANRPARWSRQAAGLVLVAKVYPTPPVTAIRAHQVSSGRAIGARASANPRMRNSTGAIAAGVALASGWPE